VLGDASRSSGTKRREEEKEEESSSSSPKPIIYSTYTLEDTLFIWKCMINEHIFMNLV
jgi:hypothetical protein